MTTPVKLLIGCGIVGCLGLGVVALAIAGFAFARHSGMSSPLASFVGGAPSQEDVKAAVEKMGHDLYEEHGLNELTFEWGDVEIASSTENRGVAGAPCYPVQLDVAIVEHNRETGAVTTYRRGEHNDHGSETLCFYKDSLGRWQFVSYAG